MGTTVLLSHMPPLLRDVLAESLAGAPGLRVVSAADDDAPALAAQLDRSGADVLVVALAAGEPPAVCAAALAARPAVKVLAVEGMGREVALYELHPVRTPLGSVSPAGLGALIGGAVRPLAFGALATPPTPASLAGARTPAAEGEVP